MTRPEWQNLPNFTHSSISICVIFFSHVENNMVLEAKANAAQYVLNKFVRTSHSIAWSDVCWVWMFSRNKLIRLTLECRIDLKFLLHSCHLHVIACWTDGMKDCWLIRAVKYTYMLDARTRPSNYHVNRQIEQAIYLLTGIIYLISNYCILLFYLAQLLFCFLVCVTTIAQTTWEKTCKSE